MIKRGNLNIRRTMFTIKRCRCFGTINLLTTNRMREIKEIGEEEEEGRMDNVKWSPAVDVPLRFGG